MIAVTQIVRDYFQAVWLAWNDFWFRPTSPALLGLLRIAAGSIILYTHVAWSRELSTFFGGQGVLPVDYRRLLTDGPCFAWSHFDWLPNAAWLWPVHLLGLMIMAAFVVGWQTRWTSWGTAVLVISYANRTTGAQFGLDQINAFLALYLAIGPSGSRFSIDRWLSTGQGRGPDKDPWATISIRLIQLHVCLVYFFAGVGKLQGETWWNGTALWGAIANFEYQTWDMTWLANHLAIVNFLTFASLFWEVSYPFVVWQRLLRPWWIMMAVIVHLGIGLSMGMLTFGMIMIVANAAFLTPEWWHSVNAGARDRIPSTPSAS